MRNAGGYFLCTGPEGVVAEGDTFTCCHCNSVVHVPAKVQMDDLGSWCTMCMKMHCKKQACFSCIPFEKKLEAMERANKI